jgi:hypothetical protein
MRVETSAKRCDDYGYGVEKGKSVPLADGAQTHSFLRNEVRQFVGQLDRK